MFFINLNNVEFMAKHGVLESEKIEAQKFIVDVKIETDQVAVSAETDKISDALNYADVYAIIHHIMMHEQYNLIETIAMKISTSIVENYESVICVDTKVTKVNPPIEGYTGTVSCEYTAFGAGQDEDDFLDNFEFKDGLEYEDPDGNIISFPRF